MLCWSWFVGQGSGGRGAEVCALRACLLNELGAAVCRGRCACRFWVLLVGAAARAAGSEGL